MNISVQEPHVVIGSFPSQLCRKPVGFLLWSHWRKITSKAASRIYSFRRQILTLPGLGKTRREAGIPSCSFIICTSDWCAAKPAFLLLEGVSNTERCNFVSWSTCSLRFVAPSRHMQEISCKQIHMEAHRSWHTHALQPKHNIHTAAQFYLCIF